MSLSDKVKLDIANGNLNKLTQDIKDEDAEEAGASGYSGFSGAQGISGYSGAMGESGYSGQDGASGFSGESGQSGFSGADNGLPTPPSGDGTYQLNIASGVATWVSV